VLFLSAPNGEADDLKKITGVGPEDALHMHGRFERDGWVVQAKALSAGKE
jgi:predicted flap endonuclease-1-like 5' DNA nuclease